MAVGGTNTNVRTATAASDLSARQYHAIIVEADTDVELAGAGQGHGILMNAPSISQSATFWVYGFTQWISGAAFSAGAQLTSDSQGRCVTAVNNDQVVARAWESSTGAGESIDVEISADGMAAQGAVTPAAHVAAVSVGDVVSGTKATLATGVVANNNAITWTAEEPGTAGNAHTIRMQGYAEHSIQSAALAVTSPLNGSNGYDIQVQLATDAGTQATASTGIVANNNAINWTAAAVGAAGNLLTAELINPSPTQNAVLGASQTASTVTVNLATDAGVASTLEVGVNGVNEVLYTSVNSGSYVGTNGNAITITHVDPGTASAALGIVVAAPDITVNLATDAGTAATLEIGVNSVNEVLYTANTVGTGGDSLRVAHVSQAPMESAGLSVGVSGNDITVGLGTDAGTAATLTVGVPATNAIDYAADTVGVGGNTISVTHVDPGVASAPLSVSATGDNITVNLATDAGTAATLTIGTPGVDDNVYTANTVGTGGNSITVTHLVRTVANDPIAVAVSGNDITVTLATDAGTDSTGVTGIVANNNAINWSVDGSYLAGTDGDGFSCILQDPAANNQSLAVTNPNSTTCQVNLATDGAGVITSTASDVITAVNADGTAGARLTLSNQGGSTGAGLVIDENTTTTGGVDPAVTSVQGDVTWNVNNHGAASALVTASDSAVGGTAVEQAQTSLTGGVDIAPNSTVQQVTDAVNADPGASALVTATATDPAGTCAVVALSYLSGGVDPVDNSTATQVLNAVNADPQSSPLVTASSTAGPGTAAAAAMANLTGGVDPVVNSTATDVLTAVNADPGASAMVTASSTMGGGTAAVAAQASLSGGTNPAITSTATQVLSQLTTDSITLLTGANAGASSGAGTVVADSQLTAGGVDPAITTTPALLFPVLRAHGTISEVVDVADTGASTGAGALVAVAETALSGGAGATDLADAIADLTALANANKLAINAHRTSKIDAGFMAAS